MAKRGVEILRIASGSELSFRARSEGPDFDLDLVDSEFAASIHLEDRLASAERQGSKADLA
jgi:hypothetical protein